jgi:predicted tellurium resistance membrane protein TerC
MLDCLIPLLASAQGSGAVEAGFQALFTVENGIALLTLTMLEIVLGIDNVVFLAILTGRLPEKQQPRARRIGLLLAMGMRIVLLFGIFWIMKLTAPLFTLPFAFLGEHEVDGETIVGLTISGKDLIMLIGGLFLIAKATYEIHHKLEHPQPDALHPGKVKNVAVSFGSVLVQVVMIDAVFSLDSVITAVGMADRIEVMITAVVIAVLVMMIFAEAISKYIERHPTLKMLALAFLVLIGVLLVADGLHQHMPRGYIYFAMAFALGVEMLNIKAIRSRKVAPVRSTDPE